MEQYEQQRDLPGLEAEFLPLVSGDPIDDELRNFDWDAALYEAGITPRLVDLTHLTFEERCAQRELREREAHDLAVTIGMPMTRGSNGEPTLAPPSAAAQLAINEVQVAREHLDWVSRVVSALPKVLRYFEDTSVRSALECVEDHELMETGMASALAARAIAVNRWRDDHDPERLAFHDAVIEAATRAPVIWDDGLPGFEAATFGELIEFVTDLPY